MMYRQDGRLGAEFPQSELVISSSCTGEGGGSEPGGVSGSPDGDGGRGSGQCSW